MRKLKLIVIFFFSLTSINSFSQNYCSYINEDSVGVKWHEKSDTTESTITYLGKVVNDSGQICYYVLTEFSRVKAANNWHGQSTLIFLNEEKELISRIELGLPSDLPQKIEENRLCFSNGFVFILEDSPPKIVCVAKDDCY